MRTIHKHKLDPGATVLKLHEGYKWLHVEVQDEDPCIWVEVETQRKLVEVCVAVFGTGHILPADQQLNHIATFFMFGGDLVFHAYEVID